MNLDSLLNQVDDSDIEKLRHQMDEPEVVDTQKVSQLKEQFAEKYSTLQIQQRRNKLKRTQPPPQQPQQQSPSPPTAQERKKFTISGLFKRKKSSSTVSTSASSPLPSQSATQSQTATINTSVKSPSLSSRSTLKQTGTPVYTPGQVVQLPSYKRRQDRKLIVNINEGVVSYVKESRQLVEEVVPVFQQQEYTFASLQMKLDEVRGKLEALPLEQVRDQQEAISFQIQTLLKSINLQEHQDIQNLKQQVQLLQSQSFDYYQVATDFGYFTLAVIIRMVATVYWVGIWIKRLFTR